MKEQMRALSLILMVMASGTALAVGPGKTLEFKGSPMGTVIFDGTAHKNAGLTCSDCHNPELFPKMKQGTVNITMNDLYAGKYCGRCHDGKKAFLIKDNCTRCHHKPGIK
ncbi:cytochrome c3 family protein [Geobacter argillaceus]|uniref:C(7)-type cytochrome triheme protein n=1 Tax=Geobacter argillaceus TaxID=345631 RepID=A0A562VFD8_9BACT|nr:cytochrome c3 family protein [Geobacter argillaceus]TWJ16558.1 c(7)-type cytochrome triheme protein [Geobacter argillaceus]